MGLLDSTKDCILLAIPKKGRLNDAVLELLQGSDLQFRRDHRRDIAHVKGLNIALVFLPAADIPTAVGEGEVDVGITGADQVAEHEAVLPATDTSGVETVMDLEFGKCKLQVQVLEDGGFQTAEELIGKTIVTSFPGLTNKFFAELEAGSRGKDAPNGDAGTTSATTVREVSGSVEIMLALGSGQAAVDLVETGDTMRAAGLIPIATVLNSTALLIKSKKPSKVPNRDALVRLITNRIRGVITAQKFVLVTYNVHRDSLEVACKITPGKRAPTINRLEEEGWVAVSSMVEVSRVATAMDELTGVGAEDIIVTKIKNTRTR